MADQTSPEITVEELKQKLDAQEDVYVLDVREPFEYQICNIGGHLIPMGELQSRVGELDPDAEIVVLCHSGVRSGRVTAWLREQGFEDVKNVRGGIAAWAEKIDPKMARY